MENPAPTHTTHPISILSFRAFAPCSAKTTADLGTSAPCGAAPHPHACVVAWWHGGSSYNELFFITDWMPTLLDATGDPLVVRDREADDFDGVSHWHTLTDGPCPAARVALRAPHRPRCCCCGL